MNDYEGKMLSDRTGWSSAEISRRVQGGLVVTLGGEGCEVWIAGEKTVVPPVKAAGIVDPTGCGDAWRGALLYGLEQGWPLARCAELGNKVGAIKIASRGPQNYTLEGCGASRKWSNGRRPDGDSDKFQKMLVIRAEPDQWTNAIHIDVGGQPFVFYFGSELMPKGNDCLLHISEGELCRPACHVGKRLEQLRALLPLARAASISHARVLHLKATLA